MSAYHELTPAERRMLRRLHERRLAAWRALWPWQRWYRRLRGKDPTKRVALLEIRDTKGTP